MWCTPSSPAQRRFVVEMWCVAGLCIVFAVVAALSFRLGHVSGLLAYLVAILPALPIVWALVSTGNYLNKETDEFQRNLLVQSLLGGIGVTLAATTVSGSALVFSSLRPVTPPCRSCAVPKARI